MRPGDCGGRFEDREAHRMDYMRTVSFRANTWLLLIVLVWNVWPTSRTRSLGFVPGGTITVSGAQQRGKPPCVLDSLSCRLEFNLFFQFPPHPRANSEGNGDQGPTGPEGLSKSKNEFSVDGVTFRGVGMFDDLNPALTGVRYHAISFVSPDGKHTAEGFLILGSPLEASADMESTLKQATSIVQREEKTGEGNVSHGDRAVALFQSTDLKETLARVMWTDGRTLHEIVSESLQYALALEKVRGPGDSKSK
jgi:hypothetical protein